MEDIANLDVRKSPMEYYQMGLCRMKEIMNFDATPEQEARLLIRSGKYVTALEIGSRP